MSTPRIISSPLERVKKTLKEAYKSSTSTEKELAQILFYENKSREQKQRMQNNVYANLLGFDSKYEQLILKEFTGKCTKVDSSLPVGDIVSKKFLKGNFESGTPYIISQSRLKVLLKGFDNLDTQDEVRVLGMRHGHKSGNDLTERGIQEAQDAGKSFNYGDQDIIFGTHQVVIESLLISLIGGSKGLTSQEARNALPEAWQEPYKTAQVTEFVFAKDKTGAKILTVTTNNHTMTFSEDECRRSYDFLGKK